MQACITGYVAIMLMLVSSVEQTQQMTEVDTWLDRIGKGGGVRTNTKWEWTAYSLRAG